MRTRKLPSALLAPAINEPSDRQMTSNQKKSTDVVNPGILSRAQTFFVVLGGVYVLVVLLLMVPFFQSQ